MWKWGGSAPCGQAQLWRPNGPQYAKITPFGSPPDQGLKNCELFKKNRLLGPTGLFFGSFCAAGHISQLAYFLTVLATPGRLNTACVHKKIHTSEWSVLYGTYSHIYSYRGRVQSCSLGRLQGHLWVTPTIGSCFYGPLRSISVFVSGLLPHTQSKTPPNTVFLPNIPLFDP